MKKPYPKRAIRTFRDLDVYQVTLEGSVIVAKNLRGKLSRLRYPFLEKMIDCNKMVVYLEQVRGLYGDKVEYDLIEETIKRYVGVRTKMLRLSKAWEKFAENNPNAAIS